MKIMTYGEKYRFGEEIIALNSNARQVYSFLYMP
jgi:hypothetical protein